MRSIYFASNRNWELYLLTRLWCGLDVVTGDTMSCFANHNVAYLALFFLFNNFWSQSCPSVSISTLYLCCVRKLMIRWIIFFSLSLRFARRYSNNKLYNNERSFVIVGHLQFCDWCMQFLSNWGRFFLRTANKSKAIQTMTESIFMNVLAKLSLLECLSD